MSEYIIEGGRKYDGEIEIASAKNALLPLISASLLIEGETVLEKCADITDVRAMLGLAESLGAKVKKQNGAAVIDCSSADGYIPDGKLSGEIRASIFLLGSILSRNKRATLYYPGGCNIGSRPIDIHLDALRALGAEITEADNRIFAECAELVGTNVKLRFPSVGATENVILAAVKARGKTVIKNAAREPEIEDLCDFLNRAGAKIKGGGKSVIAIEGVKKLLPTTYKPIPDRIETGTYLLGVVANGGKALIKNIKSENIYFLLDKVGESACKLEVKNDRIYIESIGKPKSIAKTITKPYPFFPTDLQAPLIAMLSVANGTSCVIEKIFERRFGFAEELNKLGADISVSGNRAVVRGVEELHSGNVCCTELRGGAGLLLACLRAKGVSVLGGAEHIERGYEKLEDKFAALNQSVKKSPNESGERRRQIEK